MRGPGSPPPQRPHLTADHHLIEVEAAPADHELIAARLWDLGAVGIEERPDRLVAAFTDRDTAAAAATLLGSPTPRPVAPESGLDGWREHARPVTAGPFVVHPPWLAPPASGRALVIDPGHTFGSGSHPSTRLALMALGTTVRPGHLVLDLGCGSGVLAVAAASMGADVVATDVDAQARATTAANAAANGVAGRVEVVDPDATGDGFDVVAVNLTVDLHESVAADVRHRVATTGAVIVSGVLAGEQVERAARAYRRAVDLTLADDDWRCVVLR